MREWLQRLLGTKRVAEVLPPIIEAGAEVRPPIIEAAGGGGTSAARGTSTAMMQALITQPKIQEFSLGLILNPVAPERARAILLAALQGDLWMQYDLFSKMEEWDRLGKNLNEVKNAVKRLTWNVTPYSEGDNKPTASAEEKADLVRRALQGWRPETGSLTYGFEDCVYHALDAMGKGISVQEIHWELTDGVWMPRAAHLITPRSYGWSPDGSQLGLLLGPETTTVKSAGWMPFPEDKFLVGAWHFRSGFPGATAMLRALVPYWIGITYGWQWLMQTAQIFGVPFRWATYDPNQPGLLQTVLTMLQTMGAAGYAAFPAGTTLDFKEALTSATDNPQALVVELAKQACDLVILGQTLSGESQPTGWGSGTATLHGQIRQDVLHGTAHWVADLLNYQLVPAVLRMNCGEMSEAPVVSPDLSIDPDPKTLAERDQILFQSVDLQVGKKWYFERHGIPLPAPDEEVISGRAAAALPGQTGDGSQEMGDGSGKGTTGSKDDKPTGQTKGAKDAVDAKSEVQAKSQDAVADKLVANVLEDLTGVEAKWLGGVKPVFRALIEAARNEDLTDAQFVAVLEKAQKEMPELFHKLDAKALEDALYDAMSAGVVNGAVQGFLKRGGRATSRGRATSHNGGKA